MKLTLVDNSHYIKPKIPPSFVGLNFSSVLTTLQPAGAASQAKRTENGLQAPQMYPSIYGLLAEAFLRKAINSTGAPL